MDDALPPISLALRFFVFYLVDTAGHNTCVLGDDLARNQGGKRTLHLVPMTPPAPDIRAYVRCDLFLDCLLHHRVSAVM